MILLEFWPICILTNLYTYHFAKLHCIHVTFPTGNSVFGQGPNWDMPKLKNCFQRWWSTRQSLPMEWSPHLRTMTITRLVFFHLFQFYYIFTKFNWYVCRVGLSLDSPLVCSSVSPSRRSKFPTKRRPTKKNLFTPITRSLFKLLVERTDIALLDVRFQGSML